MNPNIDFELEEGLQIQYIEQSEVDESGVKKAIKIPYLAFKYAKLIKRLKITHSISFLTRPSFINILASKITRYTFKVVINERSFPSLQYSYKGFQSSFNKALIKNLYKKPDMVISNSQGNADDLVENFKVPVDKMQVIHNPIDLKIIESIQPITSFFDPSKFNIITIGRLDKGKNHQLLIKAIHKLKNPALRLYIFGVGELQEGLEKLIDELELKEQVILMGFDPEPYKYLKSADLFAFSSNHEGFPNVLLEAMACGLPIISTNCQSGPSEIMELKNPLADDIMITDYGILVPIKNIDLMVKGLDYFTSNSNYAKNCIRNGQQRIKEFEKDSILHQYLDLIFSTSKSS